VTVPLVRFGPGAGIEAAIGAGSVPRGRTMTSAYTSKVQQLNDAFRKTLTGGKTCFTSGVAALGETVTTKVLALVQGFDVFTTENDPYGEHDFGSVTIDGTNLFWKIDYYDLSLQYGSNDPSDPAQTARVLTIMLAEEY
jgi:hypothetical protein